MKKIVLFIAFISVFQISAQQKNINTYKYVIVSSKFDFAKKTDQYQTSSLTKFLFNKNGFTAFLDNENLPADLQNNRCKALMADVLNQSKMLSTKLVIQLKDCRGDVVYTSKQGVSRNKEYKKAYQEAIRASFNSLKALNYKYQPKEKAVEKKSNPINTSAEGKKQTLPILFIRETQKGFLLSDENKKTIFSLLYTNLDELFILKNKNGIAYKDKNNWVVEYYNTKGNKIVEKYIVK